MTQDTFPKNPYASPAEEPAFFLGATDLEHLLKIRLAHQRTELAVTQLADMCFFIGILASLCLFMISATTVLPGWEAYRFYLTIFFVFFAPYLFVLTFFLNRRTPTSRVCAVWMSCVLLPAFPVGTVYGLYAFSVLVSRQARMVFSPEYRDILRRTEEYTPRKSGVGRVIYGMCTVLLLLFFLLAFSQPFLRERFRPSLRGNKFPCRPVVQRLLQRRPSRR